MREYFSATSVAMQDVERNAATDEYFKARTFLMDTNDNRRIFEAGFDRGYARQSCQHTFAAQQQEGPVEERVRRATVLSDLNKCMAKRAFSQQRTDDARREKAEAAARLTALAEDARQQYLDELAAGGEPVYPAWVDDVTALAGPRSPAVDDVMVVALANLAYKFAVNLDTATREVDRDQLEGVARYITEKLKDEIRAIISNQNGRRC